MEQKISTNTFTPSATNLMSDDVRDLLKSIRSAKREFGTLEKSGKISGTRNYPYAKIDDILDYIEDALYKYEIEITHAADVVDIPLGREILTTTLTHIPTGQWARDRRLFINEKGDNQGRGSGQTYARKDALRALLGLRAEDDDCEAGAQHLEKQAQDNKNKANSEFISDRQLGKLNYELRNTQVKDAEKKIIENYGALNQIPKKNFNNILFWINPALKPQDNP